MILPESLLIDWIASKTSEFKGDPIIVEKVIRALVLLEALKSNHLDFIFKGGTSLMLMIQEPRRFSIDIDIIVENREMDLEDVLEKVVESTDFIRWEEQKRSPAATIDKRHFKVFYKPQVKMRGDLNYILLDVVYTDNPYISLQETNVSHFLLLEDADPIKVVTPTLSSILGDKMTAYGPNTTGVPLNKPMEMIKQIYDIGSIFDRLSSLEGIRENFIKISKTELAYRGLDSNNFQLILEDIISTSLNFCVYGRIDKPSFLTMQMGVNKLSSYIYGDRFREPQAQIAISKAAYIARQIERSKTEIERFDRAIDMRDWTIEDHFYSGLNKLKKHNLEAFYYWYKTLQ